MTVEELLEQVLPNRVIEISQVLDDGSLAFLYYGEKDGMLPIWKNEIVSEWNSFPHVLSIRIASQGGTIS